MTAIGRAALTAALFASTAAAQDAPSLSLPLDCTLGETCFLQALFDHDPTEGSTDFTCGTLTRDGHGGTDFALPDLAAMRAGVPVLAAAPGRVVGIRDRHADIMADDPAAAFGDEDCGNGVAIAHGGGWVTQYCHLKRGSIAVRAGESVSRGAVLGAVGLSGATTFPHLHLSVFRDGADIDPFAPDTARCGAPSTPLWKDALTARPAGFLKTGFASSVPDFEAMKDDLRGATTLSATAPIVVWVSGYGARPGDVLDIRITHAAGVFHEDRAVMERRQEAWQRFSGRSHTTRDWPRGRYTATLTYWRDGALITEETLTADIP
ncbi:MAG: M23 family metallopeptidase [Pseudomonadota bacterium]